MQLQKFTAKYHVPQKAIHFNIVRLQSWTLAEQMPLVPTAERSRPEQLSRPSYLSAQLGGSAGWNLVAPVSIRPLARTPYIHVADTLWSVHVLHKTCNRYIMVCTYFFMNLLFAENQQCKMTLSHSEKSTHCHKQRTSHSLISDSMTWERERDSRSRIKYANSFSLPTQIRERTKNRSFNKNVIAISIIVLYWVVEPVNCIRPLN